MPLTERGKGTRAPGSPERNREIALDDPDLAGDALTKVQAPTPLIVGGNDEPVIAQSRGHAAYACVGSARDRAGRYSSIRRARCARSGLAVRPHVVHEVYE
jgi:hypothetical protein